MVKMRIQLLDIYLRLEEKEKLGLHSIPSKKWKIIEKETHGIKSRYNEGETVFLKNEVKHGNYLLYKNALCWVEEVKIMLTEVEKDKYEYNSYYELVYDCSKWNIEKQLQEELQEELERELQEEFPENHILFRVEENELFNNANDVFC